LVTENGGTLTDGNISLKVQQPEKLRLEQSFEGMYPVKELLVRKDFLEENIKVDFTGNGVVLLGNVKSQCGVASSDYVALLDVYLEGEKTEQVRMPYDYIVRKYDIYHKYMLENGDHTVELKWVNPNEDFRITLKSFVIYADAPLTAIDPY